MSVQHKGVRSSGRWATGLGPATEVVTGPHCAPLFLWAAVVTVTKGAIKLRGFVQFEGKLRAEYIVDGLSLMVNEKGQLFRTSL